MLTLLTFVCHNNKSSQDREWIGTTTLGRTEW